MCTKKGDARIARPLLWRAGGSYLFFAAFFFVAFFAICNPPFRWLWIAIHPTTRRTLPPGTSARALAISLRGLTPGARRVSGEQQLKKKGCSTRAPQTRSKNYRFFAAFFFAPLAFFAIVFSSGCCDSASDGSLARHNGWAEPSTLIPDVDYG